jgi:hypothetical protein
MKKVILLFCMIILTGNVINAQTVNVTFKVDMKVQALKGAFNPATDSVFARGSFNGWGQTAMADADLDSIYEVTIGDIPQNSNVAYKFFHQGGGGTWEDNISDRQLAVGTTDIILDPVWFDDEAMPSGNPANVTFEVDMHLPAQQIANFTTTRKVKIAGSFTDWQNNPVELTDPDNDTIYTGTIAINSAQNVAYKFIHTDLSDGDIQWESIPDRHHWVVDGDQTVSHFWNDEDPNVQLADGNIFFVVDMSVANELGVFNPSADSVQIRGEFNGWNDSDPARSLMNQDAGNPNLWFLDIPMEQLVLNDTLIYKYFIKNDPGSVPYANTGWEVAIVPTPFGNRDRPIAFLGQPDQEAGYAYFEGIHTDWVIPAGTTVEATFTVDMAPAANFNPAEDTVVWIPRQPFYYAVKGLTWPGDYPRELILTDGNSDMVYEGTMTITGPFFNGYLYNYGFVDVSAGNTLVQEGGSQGECRVRFISQDGGPRTFPAAYSFPLDTWTDGEKPEEQGPSGLDVNQLGNLIPKVYSLEQNYPNPFNPATTIRFSIPEAGTVNLSIYNLIGEKVADILNSELKSGSYEVSFDASALSSGVYFYTIEAGNFISTKKMILLK